MLLCFFVVGTFVQAEESDLYWPQWRGPDATGVARQGDPPITWDEKTNVRWKIEIPGEGSGSPVVWGDQVFVTAAVLTDQQVDPDALAAAWQRNYSGRMSEVRPSKVVQFVVMSVHRENGRILWQRIVREALPHEGHHSDGNYASASPVTDGKHVFFYFGSRGLYCFDMEGELKWETDLGDMMTRYGHGEGNSPVLYGDTIVINWDHEGQSFIVALNKNTGKERWRVNRDEVTSWSTPIVVEYDGRTQVIVNATTRTRGYDLETGEVIWSCGGMTVNTVPSPVVGNGMVYVTSGFQDYVVQAIRLDKAVGDITGSDAVAWAYNRDTPYVPSPLLYGDKLYFLKNRSNVLTCLNARTGQVVYSQQRLEGIRGMYASPLGVNDRIYLAGRNGTTVVIQHGAEFEVLATNPLDDRFDASPAVVDDALYLRGYRYLYCIASD